MPIYAYRCAACGHEEDHLQKVSETPLTKCPACGKKKYQKQLTAAGFQLKGSGWYATDFKSAGKKVEAKAEGDGKAESKSEAAPETKTEAKGESKPEGKAGKKKAAGSTAN